MKELSGREPWEGDVRRAAAILYAAGATAVWLFGSRAGQRVADRMSDFDLAVEGLSGVANMASVISRASRELRGKVDIVRMESARPDLRRAIFRCRIRVPQVDCSEGGARAHLSLPRSLAGVRTRTVAGLLQEVMPRSVIDFGCGRGWLIAELAGDAGIERLTGVDFDEMAIASARRKVDGELGRGAVAKVRFIEGIITHRDPGFLGHDAAAAVEVVEHLEQPQLAAFASVVFGHVRPRRAVITTPNTEFNATWHTQRQHGWRHPDHRFEWSRQEFVEWSNKIAETFGYEARFESAGSVHSVLGPPTQIAIFDALIR